MKFRLVEAEETQSNNQVFHPDENISDDLRNGSAVTPDLASRINSADWIPYKVDMKNAKTLIASMQSVDFDKNVLICVLPTFSKYLRSGGYGWGGTEFRNRVLIWDKSDIPGTYDGGKRIGGHNTGKNVGGKGQLNGISNTTFYKMIKGEDGSTAQFYTVSIDDLKKRPSILDNKDSQILKDAYIKWINDRRNIAPALCMDKISTLLGYQREHVGNESSLTPGLVIENFDKDAYTVLIQSIEKLNDEAEELEDSFEDWFLSDSKNHTIENILGCIDDYLEQSEIVLAELKSGQPLKSLDYDFQEGLKQLEKAMKYANNYGIVSQEDTHSKADWF